MQGIMRWLSKGVFHHCRKLKTSGPNGEESSFIGVPVIETVDFICQYSSENDIRVGLPATKLKELILRCTWGTLQTRLSNHEVNTWTYSCGQILRQTRGGTAAEYHPQCPFLHPICWRYIHYLRPDGGIHRQAGKWKNFWSSSVWV